MDFSELQVAARRAAIERAEKEYKLQCDIFDTADRKAQATTTIAGALLAADLGFVSKLSETPYILTQIALTAITVALGLSVIFALLAMFARDSKLPASGRETETAHSSLLCQSTRETFAASEVDLNVFLLEELKQANDSVSDVSGRKAQWVHRAQITLCAAAVLTIVLTLSQIWSPGLLTLKSDAAAVETKRAEVAAREAAPYMNLRITGTPTGASPVSAVPETSSQSPFHEPKRSK